MANTVDVPLSALSDEALRGLLEEYVTRDGTDYGDLELSLAEKVANLRQLIQRGEAKIVFDRDVDGANIVAVE